MLSCLSLFFKIWINVFMTNVFFDFLICEIALPWHMASLIPCGSYSSVTPKARTPGVIKLWTTLYNENHQRKVSSARKPYYFPFIDWLANWPYAMDIFSERIIIDFSTTWALSQKDYLEIMMYNNTWRWTFVLHSLPNKGQLRFTLYRCLFAPS